MMVFPRAIKFSISDHSQSAEDMPNQINHLVNIFNEMSTAGLTLPDNLKAMILLNALPHSYKIPPLLSFKRSLWPILP
jgi:hypothetical protein